MQSWMIGLVAGIIFIGYIPVLPPWPVTLLLAVMAVVVKPWRTPNVRLLSGLACGCALGLSHGTHLLQTRLPEPCVGTPVVATGKVSSLPSASRMLGGGLRQRFQFSVDKISPAHCAGPARFILSYYGDQTIVAGDVWQFDLKLKRPWGLASPGAFNMQVWFAQQGVDAVGSVRETPQSVRLRSDRDVFSLADQLRQRISGRIASLPLKSDVAAILRAITVADSAGIEPSLWFLFQQFGLNHLLVISGLHIGMVAAVGYLVGAEHE